MKVLVACEFSGVVRTAFEKRGHDAWSCDLLPANGNHIQDDVRNHLDKGWDLMIAHPPCTRLCNSGVRWLSKPPNGRTVEDIFSELEEGVKLFSDLLNASIPKIAVENPIMHYHAKTRILNYRDPDQIIQPWMFGHGEVKGTCLWLKGVPKLVPTKIVEGRRAKMHMMADTKHRWKKRSITYEGIASAMAETWG